MKLYNENETSLTNLLILLSTKEKDSKMSRYVKKLREKTGEMIVYNKNGDIITL